MMNIPTGNVTFLFTDIENDSALTNNNQDAYASTQGIHIEILKAAVESNNGFVFKTAGEAFFCSFEKSTDALNAAVEAQRKLNSLESKSVLPKLKMGIHSGKAEWAGKDYYGYITLATVNRVMSAANGGQILISSEAMNEAGDNLSSAITFRDLGERRLKDLKEPMRLYMIVSEGIQANFTQVKTLDARPNNLPLQLTNFIGRESEMAAIENLLLTSRLLTLLGSGGTGKTRLAIQTGAYMIDEFPDGVWIIELASLNEGTLISKLTASVFNLKEDGGKQAAEIVFDYLKGKKALLIFDNCEHLIAECAKLIQTLLNYCSDLKIMTTSREALRITGENLFHVPALSVPESDEIILLESMSQYEAVQLFIDRAISLRPEFTVTNDNIPALAQLCRQLDGIPLAIELAAARIKLFTVEGILDKISNRFKLLTGGSRTALPRQQTLRAMIDWSYDLLNENEKIFFQRLSVFSGGWSIEAAEAVCSGEDIDELEVIDLLSNLVDKSIVISKEVNGNTRFYMLETIRQYSLEKIISRDGIQRNHFEFFLKLSEKNGTNKNIQDDIEWKANMQKEQDNLRSAIKWSVENSLPQSVELAMNSADYWEIKGNYSEAFDILKKVINLNINTDKKTIALACKNAAYLASNLDKNDIAEIYINQALEFFRSTGNSVDIAECLNICSIISFVEGEPETAKKYLEECLILIEGKNQKLLEATVKANLATYFSGSGNTETSVKLIEEALQIYKELNNRELLAKMLISKGGIYYQSGDLEKARSCYEEGLPILEKLNEQYSYSTTLYNLGNLNFAQKKYPEAKEYYLAAVKKSKEFGHSGVTDRSQIKLGEIALHQNENEKAKSIFIACIKSFNKNSEKLKLILSFYGLCNYYFLEKDFELSAKYYFLAERISEIIKFTFSKNRLDENKERFESLKKALTEDRLHTLRHEVYSFEPDKVSEIALSMAGENK